MLLDMLLALALLLSTASQLRPVGGKIGPGEACLALWLFLTLAREVGRLGPPLTPVLSRLLTFWVVFALAMCLGTMTGFAIGDVHDPVWFWHDIFAYVVVATVSCLMVIEPGAESRLYRVAWLLVTLGAAWFALQVAYGWGLVDIGDVDPWEWDRLRGLCANSNQLALVCAVIGLLSLYLAEAASGLYERIVALMCMIVAIIVGRLTKSDAFLLALVVAVSIFAALKIRTWLLRSERKLTLRSASAWIVLLAVPLALAYVVPLADSVTAQAEFAIKEMTRGGTSRETEETARLRIHIWKEAIHRGIESGMLGLGPGPHLEIPDAIAADRLRVKPKHVVQPVPTSAPNFEAHNTFLDLFTQGGLIAVLSLVWLAGTALLLTCRAKLDGLTTLLCSIAVFGIFHLIVRHPLVWFAIAFCLVTAVDIRRPSPKRAWS